MNNGSMEGFILTGGASTRMGSDKALLHLGSTSLIERLVSALRSICGDSITLIGAAPDKPSPIGSTVNCVADLSFPDSDGVPMRTPLVGIYTALSTAASRWIAVLACDLPFVSKDLLRLLSENIDDAAEAIVPIQPDGRPQPLCALYRREPCLEYARSLLSEGDRRAHALPDRAKTRYLPLEDYDHLPGSEHFFFNINSPEDLAMAEGIEQERE